MPLKEIHHTTPDESTHPNDRTYTFVFDGQNHIEEARTLFSLFLKLEGIKQVELTTPIGFGDSKVICKLSESK